MIKLTERREITPYKGVHLDDEPAGYAGGSFVSADVISRRRRPNRDASHDGRPSSADRHNSRTVVDNSEVRHRRRGGTDSRIRNRRVDCSLAATSSGPIRYKRNGPVPRLTKE